MKIIDFEDLPCLDIESIELFSTLPFHEGCAFDRHDRYGHSSTGNDVQETEFGIINPSYNDHVTVENSNVCENRDNEINDRRISLQTDESTDRIKSGNEFKSLVPFCLVVGLGTLFSQSVSVYLSSQITVLERAFGLSSSTSGFLLSANDIGFVLTVLLASHFLKNHHIPRVLAVCIFTFGLAGILTSLPHFLVHENGGSYQHSLVNASTEHSKYLCVQTEENNLTNTQKCSDQTVEKSAGSSWVVAFIAVMMVIQGVAKAPRSPLGSLYVDNNSSREKTGFYIGLLMSFSIFGPFIAITAGGLFNKLPVDLKDSDLTPADPRWIGAWWLGFIVFGACAMIVSFPIFFFPATLRKTDDCTEKQNVEYANSSVIEVQSSFTQNLKDLPRSIIRVFRQPVYVCNLLSVLFFVFAFLALGSFGPKYIENQFRLPTWKANLILGLEKLVTTVAGTFCGGVITRRLRLGLFGCVKMLLLCRCFSFVCGSLNFLWGCDTPPIAGLDTEQSDHVVSSCDCTMTGFLPVCLNNQTFFSPCHAGCTDQFDGVYTNCTASVSDVHQSGRVTLGVCEDGCIYLLPFIIVNAFSSLIGTMTLSPSYVTMLRSVPEVDRAMAVGLQSFLLALLVLLPAPILYGAVFDSLCLVWESKCTGDGACLLYDVKNMRYKMNAISVGASVIGLIFTSIMILFAKKDETKERRKLSKSLEIKPPIPQPRTSLTKQ